MKFDGWALYERLSRLFLEKSWHLDGGCFEVHVLPSQYKLFIHSTVIHSSLAEVKTLTVVSLVT